MTTEELAVLVGTGDTSACDMLWDRVSRFVGWRARKYFVKFINPRFEIEELVNAGYFGMLEACKHYDPERAGFLTGLDLYLKSAFAEVADLRRPGQRHDACNVADSTDRPIGGEDEDISLYDLIASPEAARSIADFENRLFTEQLHAELEKALSRIPPQKAEVLRLRYFQGIDYETQAKTRGISKQAVASQADDAMWALRFDDKSIKALSVFLYGEEMTLDIDVLCERLKG